jgi:hypothetical protein
MRQMSFTWASFRLLERALVLSMFLAASVESAFAITMTNDPQGFRQIPWGAALTDIPELIVIRTNSHTTDYEFRDRAPLYADVPVESVQLSTVDAQFARVTVRYHGAQTHSQLLRFLEGSYGAIERLPGQMMRGLNQQYTWRGPETEISLTYEANRDRGFIFIESRNLAPRFQDRLSDTAD